MLERTIDTGRGCLALRALIRKFFLNRAGFWGPVAGGLIAVLLMLPSLKMGLFFDDHWYKVVIQNIPFSSPPLEIPIAISTMADGDPSHNRLLMNAGVLPWWSREDLLFSLMRPVSDWTHRLDYAIFPDQPVWMHAHSLLWFGFLTGIVGFLYQRIMGRGGVAILALLMFALNDGHVLPACWVANRNQTMGAAFGVLALLGHHQWREGRTVGGARRTIVLLSSPFCLLLAVLSNEGGIGCCAYLVAYALFLDRQRIATRWMSLLPSGITILMWRLTYRILGYGVKGSGLYIDPFLSPFLFIKNLPSRLFKMLCHQWTFDFSVIQRSSGIEEWLAGLLIVACLVVFLPVILRDRRLLFWLTGMVLALIPVCASDGGPRVQLLSSVGATAAVAHMIGSAFSKAGRMHQPTVPRVLTRVTALILIILNTGVNPYVASKKMYDLALYKKRHDRVVPSVDLIKDSDRRTAILINAPHIYLGSMFGVTRASMGLTFPGRLRVLSESNSPVTLGRVDTHTIMIDYGPGLEVQRVRDESTPFRIDQEVQLEGATFRVLGLNRKGEPRIVTCRFDVPLDDPSLIWLALEGTEYRRVQILRIGESATYGQ